MKTANQLRELLNSIDRKSYPAYKGIKGSYSFAHYILNIDHVQGDPFASPSKFSLVMDGQIAGFAAQLYDNYHKRIALQDYLIRLLSKNIQKNSLKSTGSGKSGMIFISHCEQEVLERTACSINPLTGTITLRFEIGLPAHGRTINSRELIHLLFDLLPDIIDKSLLYSYSAKQSIKECIQLAEDQQYLRAQLKSRELIAFIPNGSILPRQSGVSARPMKDALPFYAPTSTQITMDLPNAGTMIGMGIKKGITLIVGGGYHGKSTLLKALELGVYNHIKGDGREYVVTDDAAMKIRAEDGRSIKKVDISTFINHLPNKKETRAFYTEDASGSTSQAANTIEAMESGSSVLLFDEDTCATNFMVRDELMQKVVHPDQEPISPFIEKARSLYEKKGISSIIVAGSSGSYFHIADYIIQMDQYKPIDITRQAKQAAMPYAKPSQSSVSSPSYIRIPRPTRENKDSRLKLKALGTHALQINYDTIELRYIEQIIDTEQVTALGYILTYAEQNLINGKHDLKTIVALIQKKLNQGGLAAIITGQTVPANMAMPRMQEIFSCINRYRSLNL